MKKKPILDLRTFLRLPPENQRIILHNLPEHLAAAEEVENLHDLLLTFGFLDLKVRDRELGIQALIRDFDLSPHPDVGYIQRALRIASHALTRDPTQLGTQLLGRLHTAGMPLVQKLFAEAQQWLVQPWLRPLVPSLFQPDDALIRTFIGHTQPVTALAVTPDGRHMVSGSLDGTVRIWDLSAIKEAWILEPCHTGAVHDVAVSADGQWAVSASVDQTIRIWDLTKRCCDAVLFDHTDSVNAVVITADDRCIISGAGTPWGGIGAQTKMPADATVKIWDRASGNVLQTISGHSDAITALVLARNDQWIISASEDGTVRIWNIAKNQYEATLDHKRVRVVDLVATSDSNLLITVPEDRTLGVWDLKQKIQQGTLCAQLHYFDNTFPFSAVAIDPTDWLLIAATGDGMICIWDMGQDDEEEPIIIEAHTCDINVLKVTPDGYTVLSGADDGTIKQWRLQHTTMPEPQPKHEERVNVIAVTPDGQHAISAGGFTFGSSIDYDLKYWDLMTGRLIGNWRGHTNEVSALAITPDGKHVISVDRTRTLRVWDLPSGTIRRVSHGYGFPIALDPTGQWAVTPLFFNRIHPPVNNALIVWDIRTGDEQCRLSGSPAAIIGLLVAPDGREIISISDDGEITIWRFGAVEPQVSSLSGIPSVQIMSMSPDGQWLLLAGQDAVLSIWNRHRAVLSGKCVGHKGVITALAVTSDSRQVITAGVDGTLRVWDILTGASVRTITLDFVVIKSLSVMPTGDLILSISDDNMIRIWDLEQGIVIAGFYADSQLRACAIAYDGRTIVAGEASGRVHFLRFEGTGSSSNYILD